MVFNLTRKKIIAALVLLVLMGTAAYLIHEELKIVPADYLKKTMDKTLGANSYTFEVESVLYVDNKERPLSSIKGKKDSKGNYHLSGTMLRQKVEVYQMQDTTYFREASSDKWMVMENNNIMNMQQFATEVNPMSNFSFGVPEQVELKGKEKVDGRKCLVFECSPHVESEFLNRHWKNFKYTIWIDKGNKLVKKAAVSAENKENAKSVLKLEVVLKDYNKVPEIVLPEIEKD